MDSLTNDARLEDPDEPRSFEDDDELDNITTIMYMIMETACVSEENSLPLKRAICR